MPLQRDVANDPFAQIMRFRSSAVFEMLVSLQSIADELTFREFTDDVRRDLGDRFVGRLTELYTRLQHGLCVSELGTAANDPDDVPAFIEQVQAMDEKEFSFYMLGRVFPRDEIPEPVSRDAIEAIVASAGDPAQDQLGPIMLDWADDVLGFRDDLVGIWRRYYDDFFRHHLSDHVACCEQSIRERQEAMELNGGAVVYEQLAGWKELPSQIPPGAPYQEILLVPVFRLNRRKQVYYGYGQVTVLYNCMRNEQTERSVEETKDAAVNRMRALADDTRIRALKIIAHNPRRANGKFIADRLSLSPSVVSRHLKQLKDAGLIEEHSPDNRNITYHIVADRIREIPDAVLNYFHE